MDDIITSSARHPHQRSHTMRQTEVQPAIEDMGSLVGRSNSARTRLSHTPSTFPSRNANARSSGESASGGEEGAEEGEKRSDEPSVSTLLTLLDDNAPAPSAEAESTTGLGFTRGSSSRREQGRVVESVHGPRLARGNAVRTGVSDTRAAMVNKIFGSWVRPMDESLGSGWTTE